MARDELFQHIIRCEVIGAHPEHQAEWFSATMDYMSDRWHELTPKQLTDLRTLGERFAQPARSAAPAEVLGDAAPETQESAGEGDGDKEGEDAEETLDPVSA